MDTLTIVCLTLLLGSICVAGQCKLAIDGRALLDNELWYQKLKSSHKHTIHSVEALDAPCIGFLRHEPYYIRAQTSDEEVLQQINIGHEFKFLDDLLGSPPRTILDLGANVGLASAYLAAQFPSATIFGVEPDLHNFALAGMNTHRSRNVHLWWGAVWESSVMLHIAQEHFIGEWGYQMKELPPGGVINKKAGASIRGITIDDIMKSMGWAEIDYMKVDIECGEYSIFNGGSNMRSWISKVKCITMELHPWCKGKDPSTVRKAIDESGFTHKGRFGELDSWCRNQ